MQKEKKRIVFKRNTVWFKKNVTNSIESKFALKSQKQNFTVKIKFWI